MTRSRNGLQKWHRGSTVFLPTSRKIEIAKYACEPSGETVPRAENFGDLTTADHKVFNEESRNNHRYTDNSLEFGKSFEDLSWNHRTSTPHRSETNGIAERAVRRINKERLLYCCNQAWMKNGGLILWNVIAVCDMFKTSWQTGKLFTKDDSVNH